MASSAEIVRSLKIKTSTLNRIQKEYKYYQQEAEKEHARVEAMKAAGEDAHDLKQAVSGAVEVLVQQKEGCMRRYAWLRHP